MEGSYKEWKKANKVLIISEQREEWIFTVKHTASQESRPKSHSVRWKVMPGETREKKKTGEVDIKNWLVHKTMESREGVKWNSNECEKWKKKKDASKDDGHWNVRLKLLISLHS